MSDQNIKKFVKEILSHGGFDIKEIECIPNKRTPDLYVTKDSEIYIIEIKSRNDDLEKSKDENLLRQSGEVVTRDDPYYFPNRISEIVEDGTEQLSSYVVDPAAFRLLWLQAEGRDQEIQMQQFYSALYGTTNIIVFGDQKRNRECFYFHYNSFHMHRLQLDGAIRASSEGGQFCLNTYSPKFTALKLSHLANFFSSQGECGVCDPHDYESLGRAYIADCDIPRKNEEAVLKFLQDKYKTNRMINFDLTQHSGELKVDLNS
jgi:hypothetical protein